GLLLLVRLAADELEDVRVVGVQDHHLRGAARGAAALDGARAGVGAAHEADRARGRAPARQGLARRADARQGDARPRPAPADEPLLADPGEDRVHRVVDGEDEAGRALRVLPRADVEPDRRVERHLLVHEQVGELGLEGLGLGRVGEVPLLVAPAADLLDDAVEQLPDAALAPRGAKLAAEVLRRDDVGRKLRPGLRHLDVVLLEDLLAALALDPGGAPLPGHLVVRVDPWAREVTPEREAGAGV